MTVLPFCMDADVAAALATLTADLGALRLAVATLAEGQRDAVDGMALLDKGAAVSEAKADIRAHDLERVRSIVEDMSAKNEPVTAYFAAQNKAAVEAAANRANVWSYATKERVALVIAIFAGLLSWFRPDMRLTLSAPQTVQTDDASGTASE